MPPATTYSFDPCRTGEAKLALFATRPDGIGLADITAATGVDCNAATAATGERINPFAIQYDAGIRVLGSRCVGIPSQFAAVRIEPPQFLGNTHYQVGSVVINFDERRCHP